MGNEKLYSPSQIVAKLKGVTTRQILDLAEKGIIHPARETTGPGSPRLYDFENIFDICICLALRGKLPPSGKTLEHIKEILALIKRPIIDPATGDTVDEFEFLYIEYNDVSNIGVFPITKKNQIPMRKLIKMFSYKYQPQHFCTYLLEIENLRNFLKDHFE